MRQILNINSNWTLTDPDGQRQQINLPHTWNAIDGQDGGNDYRRCSCRYEHTFAKPDFDPEKEDVWLEFCGANATARAILNGKQAAEHEGGYSTFRSNITELLIETNSLIVDVNNGPSDRVYPQKADFTFYGGLYRDVNLIIVPKTHFALDYFGSCGLRITAVPDGKAASVRVESRVTGGVPKIELLDAEGKVVTSGEGCDLTLTIPEAVRWDGRENPYLYTCRATLSSPDGEDVVERAFGVREFRVDAKEGFFLNGRSYPLRGVSRHQDRKGLGNAITREMHEEDMRLIYEMGCNTIRLAHYQHDQYFYDLCDQYGMVVWAEIPYISEHMPSGRENTISQMRELIEQNYNHPSIVCWGISNEITISTKDKRDMLDNHHVLNDLVHELDQTRFTTLACYAMCGPFNPVAHITDVVSWNLYLGWYIPGLFLNDLWIGFFHLMYPHRALGFSEYGAEGMPNLHSSRPRRNDQTEEYQALYHEYMLKCFERHPWMWANHVWNMFDFAADARDQGGEPGMNHKGLVTFDRKIKKDSFYLYKAWWSQEPFVHICSSRYADRCETNTEIKVYSNQRQVTLKVNGQKVGTKESSDHIFRFVVPLEGTIQVEAEAGDVRDSATFRHVETPNLSYVLKKVKNPQKSNWV